MDSEINKNRRRKIKKAKENTPFAFLYLLT